MNEELMKKPNKLNKGDKIAIVSLSRGILGEYYVKHELDIAVKRLKEFDLQPIFMSNSLKGVEYLHNHPEARALDLKHAFEDSSIKAILCAIGGDDTYRLYPYLLEDQEFIKLVQNNPKVFIGYSDSTINHLMFYKLGLKTFYGQAFLTDFGELGQNMLSYTKKCFQLMFENPHSFSLESSPYWYEERTSYKIEELGKERIRHQETHGYEVLNGNGITSGYLYGGCIESIYDAMTSNRYSDEQEIIEKYHILPTIEEWQNKILFLETCEEMVEPEFLKQMLLEFKNRGVLSNIKGLIIGKPMNEQYYQEYKEIYKEIFKDSNTIVIYNVNFGHATPRCIIPYGALATIDAKTKSITINESIFK